MKTRLTILFIALCLFNQPSNGGVPGVQNLQFDFFGTKVEMPVDESFRISFPDDLNSATVKAFAESLEGSRHESVVQTLLSYKNRMQLEDWLYYQLIRRTAQAISPKAENYYRYTLYKWFLLVRSGYDARLKTGKDKLLFYVQCDENIYNIPAYRFNGKQYVCLNYHDYGSFIDFDKEYFNPVTLQVPENAVPFSYRITRLPAFDPGEYQEKQLHFSYHFRDYAFRIKLNPQVKTLFANYPVVDYASYFNIPLSPGTYSSLIPLLRENTRGMNVKQGVDYLMRFTRYAFLFEQDTRVFGNEKRLTPEQTLLYEQSDCEDRAALFFYLVRELYDLPMIVLAYPEHVTVAVKFDKPVGKPVIYNGEKYSVCEPTPQKDDLGLGEGLPSLSKKAYEVVYAYHPGK